MGDKQLSRLAFDEERIDSLFAEVNRSDGPGAAVGIAVDGVPVYRKGFGLANVELPVVLTPSTRMRLGSTTKQFTCLAYLLLCEEGLATLDDRLVQFLPELHPVTHGVTVRQLMGNVSGLRDSQDFCFQFSGLAPGVTNKQLAHLYQRIGDVNARPNEAFCYNNGGFILLSEIIERITGRRLEDVLRERVFVPIGLYDTLLRRRNTDFVANSAIPHMTNHLGQFERRDWMDHAGQGGVVSTVDDMLKWMAHMSKPSVGSAETWSAMKQAQRLRNGTATGYGMGLHIGRHRGVETLHHGGGWLGASCQMLMVPSIGIEIVILMNRNPYGSIKTGISATRVLDECLAPSAPLITASREAHLKGVFCSKRSGKVIQLWEKDGSQVASIGGSDQRVSADDDGRLRSSVWGFTIETVVAEQALVSIRFNDYGNLDELDRVDESPRAESIHGEYVSETSGVKMEITEEADALHLKCLGAFGFTKHRLTRLGDRVWRAGTPGEPSFWGGILLFDEDYQGFRYSTFQTWALPFVRLS